MGLTNTKWTKSAETGGWATSEETRRSPSGSHLPLPQTPPRHPHLWVKLLLWLQSNSGPRSGPLPPPSSRVRGLFGLGRTPPGQLPGRSRARWVVVPIFHSVSYLELERSTDWQGCERLSFWRLFKYWNVGKRTVSRNLASFCLL